MRTLEYLGFIPLLMYGLGLADLLSQWKRLFDRKEWYLPYTIFTIVLTEIAVYNVFIYFNLLAKLPGQNYYTYLSYLLPPFLFLLTIRAFTPENDEDTKQHFVKRMPIFFSLLAAFILSHFVFNYEESIYMHIVRLFVVVILIVVGFTRKMWLVYLIALIWLVSFLFRGKLGSSASMKESSQAKSHSEGITASETKYKSSRQHTTVNFVKTWN